MTLRHSLIGGLVAVALTGAVFLGSLVTPAETEAQTPEGAFTSNSPTGYLCRVFLVPVGSCSTCGTYGYVNIRLYAEPGCAGGSLGSASIYSEGATTSNSDSNFRRSEAALYAEFLALQQAQIGQMRVQPFTCSSSKRSCVKYMGYRDERAN